MKNILIALDLNEGTESLIDKSLQLLDTAEAKVWLVHIAAPEPDFVGYGVGPKYIRDFRAEELREEHKLLSRLSNEIKEKGIASEGLLIQGATVEMLLEEAKKLEAEVIVMGKHERGLMYKLLMGDTSGQLLKQSALPVLVLPV